MQAAGPQAPRTSLVLSALTLCVSMLPQVERLETKVIWPLKLYGAHIKQTRVSRGPCPMGSGLPGHPGNSSPLSLGRDQEIQTSPEERDETTGKAGETEAEVPFGSANDRILSRGRA